MSLVGIVLALCLAATVAEAGDTDDERVDYSTLDPYMKSEKKPDEELDGTAPKPESNWRMEIESKTIRELGDEIGPDRSHLMGVKEWLEDVEAAVRIHSDPVKRAIVCRVPFTEVSITALVLATKIPRPRIMQAAADLERMGLVKIGNNITSQWIIQPASKHALYRMWRWARHWCASDEECGVRK